jgi:hypothetical protein
LVMTGRLHSLRRNACDVQIEIHSRRGEVRAAPAGHE